MKERIALERPLEEPLMDFSAWLWRNKIPHRVSEVGGKQVFWARKPEHALQIEQAFIAYDRGDLVPPPVQHPKAPALFKRIQFAAMPVTIFLIVGSIIGALLVHFVPAWAQYLTWFEYEFFMGRRIAEQPADEAWRMITPIFLHYGVLHVAFNSLLTLEFGGIIERRHGSMRLIGIALVIAVLSNLAQVFASGTQEFGGMSGVVFGLFGYCFAWSFFRPEESFGLPKAFVVLMFLSLVAGYAGFSNLLGLGDTANACHTGGLVVGLIIGALVSFLDKPAGHYDHSSTDNSKPS